MLSLVQSYTGLPDGDVLYTLVALITALLFVLFCDLIYRLFIKIFTRR